MKTRLLTVLLALPLANLATGADISHRKADLTVEVRTPSGVPLEGATVDIEMLNHAFRFGCAVEYNDISPSSSNYDEFTVQQVQKYFNSATYGNYMKWSYVEGRSTEANQAIAALPQTFKAFDGPDNFRLRGHVTIWGAEYQLPSQLKSNRTPSAETVHNLIIDHVEAFHTIFKDSGIDSFDLYNEHFNVPQLLIDRIAPPSDMAAQAAEVATWFNKAKEADPSANLFINDFNILNDWSGTDNQVKAYKAFIDAVRDAGGQIDGIGLQAHIDHPNISKAVITRRLDLLAADMAPTANHPNGLPGLRIEITELDMAVKNEIHNASWVPWTNPTMQDQVAQTDAVLSASFEHPSVDGITIWGLDDFRHWRGNALLYDNLAPGSTDRNRIYQDPVLKETGQLYIDKVKGEWWEDHSGTSATNGDYSANTFKGTHRVTVTFNGESKEVVAHLADDETLVFEFAASADDAASYDAWKNFIDWGTAASSRNEDPDGDGIDNLDEYIYGSNPLIKNAPAELSLVTADGTNFSLNYAIRAVHSGLSIWIEQSTNLKDWEAAPITEQSISSTIVDGKEHFSVPLSSITEDTFYRINAQEAGAN